MRLCYFSSSVNSFFNTSILYMWTAKALARLHRCAVSPEPSLVYVISIIISWQNDKTLIFLERSFEFFKLVRKWYVKYFCEIFYFFFIWLLVLHLIQIKFEPPRDQTNKMTVRPAKTQISLGICPVWSASSLWAQWVAKDPSFLNADSEDSDQTGQIPRLIGSLRWAHMPFCWFCQEAAHFSLICF